MRPPVRLASPMRGRRRAPARSGARAGSPARSGPARQSQVRVQPLSWLLPPSAAAVVVRRRSRRAPRRPADLPFCDEDAQRRAGGRGWDLDRRLVGLDLDERLVLGDLVAAATSQRATSPSVRPSPRSGQLELVRHRRRRLPSGPSDPGSRRRRAGCAGPRRRATSTPPARRRQLGRDLARDVAGLQRPLLVPDGDRVRVVLVLRLRNESEAPPGIERRVRRPPRGGTTRRRPGRRECAGPPSDTLAGRRVTQVVPRARRSRSSQSPRRSLPPALSRSTRGRRPARSPPESRAGRRRARARERVVDLRVTQVVNEQVGVHAVLRDDAWW